MAKVLVLDDDRLSQKLLGKVFSNAGHETLAALTTQQAWEKLHEHVLVDMIVLDNQLDQEWGWQFMRTLRNNPAYQGLPVIVYTAHTERDSIVRYLELGVQSVNMKPYHAEVLLAELGKATRSNWAAHVMESPETICERMDFSQQDYCSLLATANRTIAEKQQVALARLTSPNSSQLFAALDCIGQQCRSVGIVIVDGVIEKIKRGVSEQDLHAALDGFRSLDSFLGMIRHRMLAVMKMDDSVARAPLPVEVPEIAIGSDPKEAALFATSYAREIINKPLWHFGPFLKRAMRHPFVTPEELLEMSKDMAVKAPFSTISESLSTLQSIPKMGVEEAVAIAWDTRGFTPVYQFILEKVTGIDHRIDSRAALSRAASQQGIARLTTLAAVTRIANDIPKESPLNLRELFAHTFTATLIGFEIGRLLKLQNDFMRSAAGIAHDAGRWLLGIGEPGGYGLALAIAEGEQIPVEEAETALFGMDHHRAGQQMLACMGQSELMQSVALLHHNPSKVTDKEFITTSTVTHLAHILAQAAIAGPTAETKRVLLQLRSPDYLAWGLLKSRGANLPFDAPELVDTLIEVAATSNWIAHQLISGADVPRVGGSIARRPSAPPSKPGMEVQPSPEVAAATA